MRILFPSTINNAISVIRKGGIILYPTDTLYGIGGDARSKSVVEKICSIKARDKDKPLSIIAPDITIIKKYCIVTRQQEKIMKKYLPGPYTFILKLKKKLPVTNTGKIGVRIPSYPPIVRICKLAKVPIITTSANISGKKDPRKLSEVNPKVQQMVDLIIDGGETKYKKGSTVVDLVSRKVLRKGAGKISL